MRENKIQKQKTGQNCLRNLFIRFSSLSLLCITVVILGMIFSVLIHAGYAAWLDPDPSWVPPNSDIDPPINTSNVTQEKIGGLDIATSSGGFQVGPIDLASGEKVRISTATKDNVLVVYNDKVGIYSNTPEYPLAVEGNIGAVGGGHFVTRESGGQFEMYQGSTSAYGGEVPGVLDLSLRGSGGEPGGFVFKTNETGTSTEKVRIDPDGQVGIGITDPSARLDILETGTDSAIKAINNNKDSAAIYAKNNNSTGTAITGVGGNIGLSVPSSNQYGVIAYSSGIGVYAEGVSYGLQGLASTGAGVYGEGSLGVKGVSGTNYGELGTSAGEGLHAEGANFGVKAIGATGVYGEGTTYGIYAKNSSNYAAYIEGTSYMTNTVNIGNSTNKLASSALAAYTNGNWTGAKIESEGLTGTAAFIAKGTKANSNYSAQAELGKVSGSEVYGVYGGTTTSGSGGALGYRNTSTSIYYGVYGKAGTASGTNYAGYFAGDVAVDNATLSISNVSNGYALDISKNGTDTPAARIGIVDHTAYFAGFDKTSERYAARLEGPLEISPVISSAMGPQKQIIFNPTHQDLDVEEGDNKLYFTYYKDPYEEEYCLELWMPNAAFNSGEDSMSGGRLYEQWGDNCTEACQYSCKLLTTSLKCDSYGMFEPNPVAGKCERSGNPGFWYGCCKPNYGED